VGEVTSGAPQAGDPCFAEVDFGVEVDFAEDAVEFGFVFVFDGIEGVVDEFADFFRVPLAVEGVEGGGFREDEAFAAEPSLDHGVVIAELSAEFLDPLTSDIAEVLEEEHGEDVVLVD
jgi:hypothetical protein